MLDTDMKNQLKAYLERLTKPVELVATLDDSNESAEIRALLTEIAGLSDLVVFREQNDLSQRKPSFLITTPAHSRGPVLPVRQWGMSLPRWYWHCYRLAVIRQKKLRHCWSKSANWIVI